MPKTGNGLLGSNQGFFTAKPRHNRAVYTFWMHLPTSPCITLSKYAEPISQGHWWIWQHEAESLTISICTIGW